MSCEGWNTEGFFETATVDVVTACLAAGVDVAARDDDRITPLHWAAWSNQDPKVIEVLLVAGADLEARNDDERTPLHYAARNTDDPAVIQVFLAAGADLEARSRFASFTPLNMAAQNENVAVFEVLVAAGADLETRLQTGRTRNLRNGLTILHSAAWSNENPGHDRRSARGWR